jgi:hypothetical protein
VQRLAITTALWYGVFKRPRLPSRVFGPVAQPDRATVS